MTAALALTAQTPTVIRTGDYTATVRPRTTGAGYVWAITVETVSAWSGKPIVRALHNGSHERHATAVADAVRCIDWLAQGFTARSFVATY